MPFFKRKKKKPEEETDKGRLLFEEDLMRYSERHSNKQFLFGFVLMTASLAVTIFILLLIFYPGADPVQVIQLLLRLTMMAAYVFIFAQVVRGDGPMKFYENGFEIMNMGKPMFYKYADFENIERTRWMGEPRLKLKRRGRSGGSLMINQPSTYMDIYLLSIRGKMGDGRSDMGYPTMHQQQTFIYS